MVIKGSNKEEYPLWELTNRLFMKISKVQGSAETWKYGNWRYPWEGRFNPDAKGEFGRRDCSENPHEEAGTSEIIDQYL